MHLDHSTSVEGLRFGAGGLRDRRLAVTRVADPGLRSDVPRDGRSQSHRRMIDHGALVHERWAHEFRPAAGARATDASSLSSLLLNDPTAVAAGSGVVGGGRGAWWALDRLRGTAVRAAVVAGLGDPRLYRARDAADLGLPMYVHKLNLGSWDLGCRDLGPSAQPVEENR